MAGFLSKNCHTSSEAVSDKASAMNTDRIMRLPFPPVRYREAQIIHAF